MPKEPGEPRPDQETVETRDLPVLDPEVERLDKLRREQELKERKKVLREAVKKAENIEDVVAALNAGGFSSLTSNIEQVFLEVGSLVKAKQPDQLMYTIERVLHGGELFKGDSFSVGDAYINKKIRSHLVNYIREQAGAI